MKKMVHAVSAKAIGVAFLAFAAFAQTVAAPSFEVASIKLNPRSAGSWFRFLPGGRLSAESWIKQAIEIAYGVESYQVEGGPGWIKTQWYFIEAKAADPSTTREQMLPMLQTLLAERFKLKLHKESRDVPVFELVIGKDGLKTRPLKEGESYDCRRAFVCGIETFAQLADSLRFSVGRPVMDKTGLPGRYNLPLDFDTYSASGKTPPPGFDKPSLSTALQEQLGLRLQDAKATMPIYVIESIERPTEN